MANIKVNVDYQIVDGQPLTFIAPCPCSEVDGLTVCYAIGQGQTLTKEFVFKDAHGQDLSNVNNLFDVNAYVKVILDTKNKFAYLQNADTNAYLEGKFTNIDVKLNEVQPIAKGGTGATNAANARSNLGITPANIGAVPKSRTVNGKELSSNITLSASDVGASSSSHNHDSSYLKKYDLNTINIDSTSGNWTVDISETGHGTIPSVWVNVTQFSGDHFVIQKAVRCTNDSNTSRDAGSYWVRDKYNSGAWSAWTKVFTETEVVPIANGGTGATSKSKARANLGILFESGSVGGESVAAKSHKDYPITFDTAFPSAPSVMICFNSSTDIIETGGASCSIHSRKATGFTIRVYNSTDSTVRPYVMWQATYIS